MAKDLFGYDAEAAAAKAHNDTIESGHRQAWSNYHKTMFPTFEEYTAHHSKLKAFGSGFESAIRDYTGDSSAYNDHLIHGHPLHKLYVNHIARISGALRHPSMALTAPLVTFTGINAGSTAPNKIRANPLVKLGIGQKIRTPRFISSSTESDIAVGMAEKYDRKTGPLGLIGPEVRTAHVIQWHLPKGHNKGAYVGSMSEVPEESEFLLDRDQKFVLKGRSIKTAHREYMGNIDVMIHHMEPVEK